MTRRDFFLRTGAGTGILVLAGAETSCSITTLVAALLDAANALQAALPILSILVPPPYAAFLPVIAALLKILASSIGGTAAILLARKANALHQVRQMQSYWQTVKVDPNLPDKLSDDPLSAEVEASPRELVREAINSTNAFLLALSMQIPGVETKMQSDNGLFALHVPTAVSSALKTYAAPIPIKRFDRGTLTRIFDNTQAIQVKIKTLALA